MATPLDFLERVLPWPGPDGSGWANLHWMVDVTGKDGKHYQTVRGTPYKTASSLINRAERLAMDATKAKGVYFCLSQQAQCDQFTLKDGRVINIAKRNEANTASLKAIWLEVDVKPPPKGYTDIPEARRAVRQFCRDAKLPLPSALVNSGGGMHVYWISDKPLTVDEWRPYAQGLWAEIERLGLRCDPLTTDCARILRVPGTFNRKEPQERPVILTSLGVDYNFETDLAHLKAIGETRITATVTRAAAFDLTPFKGGMHPLLAADPTIKQEMAAGEGKFTDLREDVPLKVANVIRECPHFQDAAVNRGKSHGQGLWMHTVLACTFLDDGYKWAKRFSDKHATYDLGKLDDMWHRKLEDRAKLGLGWPSCKKIEDEGCKLCATCKWKGHIKSPLSLADRVQTNTQVPLPPAPVINPQTKAVLTAADLMLPNGYTLENGRVCATVPDEEDETKKVSVEILDGEIITRPKIIQGDPCLFFFKYRHGVNYVDAAIPIPAFASDQTTVKALYEAGVHVHIHADRLVRKFMRTFSSKIDAARKRLAAAPLGWVYDGGTLIGFAYAGVLYKLDGTEDESGVVQTKITKHVGPCGDIKYIFDAMQMISDEHNPGLETLALQAWVSVMLILAGLRSTAAVWGYSQAGAHKSTALITGAALWYAPQVVRERGGATVIGLENKMSALRNLPCILDEMTNDDEIEGVEKIFNRVGEGGQGSRGARNGDNRDPKNWQLVLACGANRSLYDYYDRKKVQTDAKAVRIFEVQVEKKQGARNRTDAQTLIGALEHNYGHLGVSLVKYLVTNLNRLQGEYKQIADMVENDLALPEYGKLDDRERFWGTTVALTLLAANVANEVCGKAYFHYDDLKVYLYDQFRRNRKWVQAFVVSEGSAQHTSEGWAKVARAWINNQLATDIMHEGTKGRPMTAVPKAFSQPPLERGYPVLMHWVKTPAMLRIAEEPFKETLQKMELGLGVYERLKNEFGGKVSRKVFLAGMPVSDVKSRIRVWEIPITEGHPLYDEWADKVLREPASGASALAQKQDAVTAAVTQTNGFQAAMATAMEQAARDKEINK